MTITTPALADLAISTAIVVLFLAAAAMPDRFLFMSKIPTTYKTPARCMFIILSIIVLCAHIYAASTGSIR
jgi:hypothetical protein